MTQHRPTRSSNLPSSRMEIDMGISRRRFHLVDGRRHSSERFHGDWPRRVCSPRMTRPPAGFRRFASTIASQPRVVYLAQRRLLREVDTVNEVPTKIEIG
jgi:hypothetical protein